jgi:sec-independent protein translocase protein TatA
MLYPPKVIKISLCTKKLIRVMHRLLEKFIFVKIKKDIMNISIILGVVGPWQIILVLVVIVLLFGGKKLPELMKGIGQGMKEFKKATKEEEEPSK